MNELVTVIIPLYNAAKFISGTLDSLYAQTYQNFQIMIVDDGSTDESVEICERYAQERGNLKIFHQENRGPASARNMAIDQAEGEFLYFIDADDFAESNALEVLLSVYRRTNADWILTEYYDLFDDGRIEPCRFWSPGECLSENDHFYHISQHQFIDRIIANHQKRTGINCWGNLFRSDIIQDYEIRFNEMTRRSEDFVFCLKYIAHIKTVAIPKELCFYYRQHTSHVSAKEVLLPFESYIENIRHIESPLRDVLQRSPSVDVETVERCVSGYLINLIFPWVVKQCRTVDCENYNTIRTEFRKLTADAFVQKALKSYRPAKNHSKLLPLWIKMKAIHLLIMTGKKLAEKRFEKSK